MSLSRRNRILLYALSLIVVGSALYSQREGLSRLHLSAPIFALPCVLGLAGVLLFNAALFRQFIHAMDIEISWAEALRTTTVSTALNSIFPQAGNVSRVIYFKARGIMDPFQFASSLIGISLLCTLVCSWGAAVGSLILLLGQPHGPGLVLLLIALGLCAPLTALVFLPRFFLHKSRGGFKRLAEAWLSLCEKPDRLRAGLLFSLAQLGLQMIIFWSSYRILGTTLTPLQAGIGSSFGLIAALLAPTPSSLGFYDATVSAVAGVLQVPVAVSLAAVFVQRAGQWIALGIFTLLSLLGAHPQSELPPAFDRDRSQE